MDQVDFEPAHNWSATVLKPDDHHLEDSPLARWIDVFLFIALLIVT